MTSTSHNNIAQAIYQLLKDKADAEQSSVIKNVVKFLNKKRILSHSGDIFSRLRIIINHENGLVVAHVSSAQKLDEKIKIDLVQNLTERYSAKNISLIEKIDESLIGGLKIEVLDEIIDLTTKNKIQKLQEHLIKSA